MLYLIEVKSYLDSLGVIVSDLKEEHEVPEGRYKLLTSENFREIVTERLRQDWLQKGLIHESTRISFGLVAGNVHKDRDEDLKELIREKDWMFWGPDQIKEKLWRLKDGGYEDSKERMIMKLIG